MAKFQVGKGLDEYIANLGNLEFRTPEIVGKAIFDGAKIVADQIRAAAGAKEGIELGVHLRADAHLVQQYPDIGIGRFEFFDAPLPVGVLRRISAYALKGQLHDLSLRHRAASAQAEHGRQYPRQQLSHASSSFVCVVASPREAYGNSITVPSL